MELNAQTAGWGLAGSILCFLIASALAVREVKKGTPHARVPTLVLMGLGFALITLFLKYQGGIRGRCPITTLPEILVFLSWSTVLIYFIIGPTYRLSLLGVFTAPVVAFFIAIGMISGAVAEGPPEVRTEALDPWLETHASVSLVSYGAFALAFVAAVMYLIQDRLLKKRSLTPLFYNLPPVSYLHNAVVRLMLVGFVLLSIGIGSAFFIENLPSWTKVILSVPVWLGYGILLGVHFVKKSLTPKGLARASVLLFILPLVTLTILGRR